MARQLITVGHGTLSAEEFLDFLTDNTVESIVDIRTAPGSRRNPYTSEQHLRDWLPRYNIKYRWEKRLGGFRKPAADSPDVAWRNDSFRGYAGYARTPEFLAAMDTLLGEINDQRTAVMCAESVWWRCHRRIVADFAVLARGVPVEHLMHGAHPMDHKVTEGARLRDDGLLVYDGGE